jgi:hypothetical protein
MAAELVVMERELLEWLRRLPPKERMEKIDALLLIVLFISDEGFPPDEELSSSDEASPSRQEGFQGWN